jgi:hypothetical protein
MKHKRISHLDLVPVPKVSHYNMQVFQNPKKSESETVPVPSISDKGYPTCTKKDSAQRCAA